jgi:hypothetical protein
LPLARMARQSFAKSLATSRGAVMTFEIESRWRGAPIKVTVEAKRTPQKKARELRSLTEAPVQVWLCKDHMRYLVHETN